ncbi:MAG: EpsG family protein [Oxalobacteraceae bacterium]|nr:EpsG family protein [Oxalobacteraceae bacterium]
MQYTILLFVLIFLHVLDYSKADRRTLLIGSIILLSSFAVVYSQTGSIDYDGYKSYFDCIGIPDCSSELSVEYGFKLIVNVFQVIFGDNFWLFISSYSVLAIIIKLYFLKKYSPYFMLSVFFYFCYNFLMHDMTQVRVGISLAFFWLAIDKYCERLPWKSFGFFLLAVLMHTSALVGGIIYLLSRESFSKRFYYLLIPVSYIISFSVNREYLLSLPSIFFPDSRLSIYSAGFENEIWAFNPISPTIIIFLVANILLMIKIQMKESSAIEIISCKLGFFAVAAFSLTYWVPALGIRAFEYLNSLYPLVFVFAIKKYNNKYIYALFFLFGLFYWENNLINHEIMLDFFI